VLIITNLVWNYVRKDWKCVMDYWWLLKPMIVMIIRLCSKLCSILINIFISWHKNDIKRTLKNVNIFSILFYQGEMFLSIELGITCLLVSSKMNDYYPMTVPIIMEILEKNE
jgi:hypothetical protein